MNDIRDIEKMSQRYILDGKVVGIDVPAVKESGIFKMIVNYIVEKFLMLYKIGL